MLREDAIQCIIGILRWPQASGHGVIGRTPETPIQVLTAEQYTMAKSQDSKKAKKKEPTKTFKEKRAAKKSKQEEKRR